MQKIDWTILKRSINGNLTEREKLVLDKWRRESKANERYYQKMRQFFCREGDEDVDITKNFKEFERKTYRKQKHLLLNVLKYAAVFILIGGVVALWPITERDFGVLEKQNLALVPRMEKAILYTGEGKAIMLESGIKQRIVVADSFNIEQDSNLLSYAHVNYGDIVVKELHTIQVPRGGEFSMKLSDGTMVYLNSESDLRYPVQFNGGERRVSLSGEAYFNVEKSDKPFIVEVDEFEVKVLGTRFNVHAYKGEASFETTLEQGSVEIGTKSKKMLLIPGEQAVLTSEGELTKRKVDVGRYIGWKDGYCVFEDERLEDVMNMIARWYDIQVFYQNSVVKDVRINGNINRYKDFAVLLEKIEKLDIVHFKIRDKMIIVEEK